VPKTREDPTSTDGPGLERTITLTDAVVAIAMTLLILPLVEVSQDVETDRPAAFLVDHADLLISFVVSFLVIYAFWAAHGSAFRRLAGSDRAVPALRLLNMLWLLVVAFLPFPTAVVGKDLNTTTGPIYIGTMVVLSALTSAIMVVVDRATDRSGRTWWAWLTTAVFALCTVLSLVDADVGMLALLLLVVLRAVEVRVLRR
jgi:uncharacterized membrane protein